MPLIQGRIIQEWEPHGTLHLVCVLAREKYDGCVRIDAANRASTVARRISQKSKHRSLNMGAVRHQKSPRQAGCWKVGVAVAFALAFDRDQRTETCNLSIYYVKLAC